MNEAEAFREISRRYVDGVRHPWATVGICSWIDYLGAEGAIDRRVQGRMHGLVRSYLRTPMDMAYRTRQRTGRALACLWLALDAEAMYGAR